MDAFDVQQTRLMADRGFRRALEEIRSLARNRKQGARIEEELCEYAYLAVRFIPLSGKGTPKERWEVGWSR